MSDVTVVKVLADLESVVNEVIAPNAIDVDVSGKFPRAALDALGKAGLLGLVSATEVGGLGLGHRAATLVVQRIARECASTAMIVAMHYAGAAVIDGDGYGGGTGRVGHRRVHELAGRDRGRRHRGPGRHRHAVVLKLGNQVK